MPSGIIQAPEDKTAECERPVSSGGQSARQKGREGAPLTEWPTIWPGGQIAPDIRPASSGAGHRID